MGDTESKSFGERVKDGLVASAVLFGVTFITGLLLWFGGLIGPSLGIWFFEWQLASVQGDRNCWSRVRGVLGVEPFVVEVPQVPIGSIVAFGGMPLPTNATGWWLCDGSMLSESAVQNGAAGLTLAEFNVAYAMLQPVWGPGEPTSPRQLQLPNLQGQFLRGVDVAGVVDLDVQRRSGGLAGQVPSVGSKQPSGIGAHTHAMPPPAGENELTVFAQMRQGEDTYRGPGYAAHIDGYKLLDTGKNNNATGDTRPVNTAVYWMIRLK